MQYNKMTEIGTVHVPFEQFRTEAKIRGELTHLVADYAAFTLGNAWESVHGLGNTPIDSNLKLYHETLAPALRRAGYDTSKLDEAERRIQIAIIQAAGRIK